VAKKKAEESKPKKKVGRPKKKAEEPKHLVAECLTIKSKDSPHQIHMHATDSVAGVWITGPKKGECLCLVSTGDCPPYVCFYGGTEGYDAKAAPLAVCLHRDGKAMVQLTNDKGEVEFADIAEVVAHARSHGLMASSPPAGGMEIPFALPPHVDTSPEKAAEPVANDNPSEEGGKSEPADSDNTGE
jgi:hypothetical protein